MMSNPKLYGEDDARLFDILKWQESEPEDDHLSASGIAHEYIAEMRDEETWGSAIEIACFVNMFYCKVVVILAATGENEQSQCEFVPRPSIDMRTGSMKALQATATLYYTGNHYEPVRAG